ncbi:MAG: exodeoxyribonuclease V subunit alpha [Deltaproteobacteria bacterium]|nr:exodeoxyribonuclease V subunit alpha [Deltaproteobacteria bacterium]
MIPTLDELYSKGYLSRLDLHFARAMGRLAPETSEAVLLAAALCSRFISRGHVCVDLNALAGRPVVANDGELPGARWPADPGWRVALQASPMTGSPERVAPLVLDAGGRLYLARYWHYQQSLVRALLERAGQREKELAPDLLEKGLDRLFPASPGLSGPDMQRVAAKVSLDRHLTVISGGPGTGKTFTVVKIIALAIEQALNTGRDVPHILMAAPTGKAAARLKDAVINAKTATGAGALVCIDAVKVHIPEEAATIHRLLGVRRNRPNRFFHDAGNPLAVDILIVDEASMVDLSLMANLVAAVPPHARLILLGDKDQLASVEAGAILGDICTPPEMPRGSAALTETGRRELPPLHDSAVQPEIGQCIVNLTHSYRFDSHSGIGCLARAINRGDADEALAVLQDKARPEVMLVDSDDVKWKRECMESLVRQYYVPCFEDRACAGLLERFAQFRILCALRRGEDGVEALNAVVAAILKKYTGIDTSREWYPGRPIMVTRNDYQLNLFNGDVALIAKPDAEASRLAAFFMDGNQKARMISPARLPAHETVYAMTVHKSQGTEFDAVLLALPRHVSPVVTRELFYTGVTRAKNKVVVLATRDIVKQAVRTRVQRASGLSEKLWSV